LTGFALSLRERQNESGVPWGDSANAQTAGALLSEARWHYLATLLALTPRQSQLARLICGGHTYKLMAFTMGISINTVRVHMRALFVKLGVHDRLGVVLRVLSLDRAVPQEPRAEYTH
jgi:DNA-binding NarL/FixJ family response regulator